jgi:drug/metabolite transporter (DMT)-like permease
MSVPITPAPSPAHPDPGQLHPTRRGLLQISLTGLLWGTTGVVVRQIQNSSDLSSATIGGYRLGIAAIVLALVVRPTVLARAIRSAPLGIGVGGLLLGGYQVLYFVSVRDIGVGIATLISLGLAPVVAVLWEAVGERRRPSGWQLVSLVAALVGLALVSLGAGGSSRAAPRPVEGLLAGVACGLGYGAATLVSRRVAGRVAPIPLTAATSAIGALVLLIPALLGGGLLPHEAGVAAGLGYIGVVTTAVGYVLFYAGLRTVPGSVAAVLTLIEPLTAAALAVVLLGERLSVGLVGGGGLMLAAVALLYRRPASTGPAVARVAAAATPAGGG